MPPAIHTLRLSLVPVAAGDGEALQSLVRSSQACGQTEPHAWNPGASVQQLIADHLDPSTETTLWHISPAAGTRACVGLVGLRAPTPEVMRLRAIGWRSLEVFIFLDPAARGQGLATAAIEAVAANARASATVFALLACAAEPDVRSHRLFQRSGFQELGRIAHASGVTIVHELAL